MTSTRGETIDDTWPTTTTTTTNADADAENIHWETVRTDEEVYLDKLQSKLERVMSHVVDSRKKTRTRSDRGSPAAGPGSGHEPDHDGLLDHDVDHNSNDNVVHPVDDDEGLHLLYDHNPNYYDESHVDYSEDTDNLIATTSKTDDHNPDISPEEAHGRGREYQEAENDEHEQRDTTITTTTTSPTRPRIVRFRSRVRIGSGIRNISTSSSSTSSISVPLRGSGSPDSRPNLSGHTTASLTEMLTTDATSAWLSGLSAVRRARREQHSSGGGSGSGGDNSHPNANVKPQTQTQTRSSGSGSGSTERTALLARVYSFGEPVENDVDDELDRIQIAVRKSEEDVMFGKWPWRLFNRYWWWWRVEPVLCFCRRFDDESDSDI